MGLRDDSGTKFLDELDKIAAEDAVGLKEAQKSYGESWKIRGGVGAFMMLARKFDRLQIRVEKLNWDIFEAIISDQRSEGIIDDVVDLRRYLMLVEAEMRARGFKSKHRDNETTLSNLSLKEAEKDLAAVKEELSRDNQGWVKGQDPSPTMIEEIKDSTRNCCNNCIRYLYEKMGRAPTCQKVPRRPVPTTDCKDFLLKK